MPLICLLEAHDRDPSGEGSIQGPPVQITRLRVVAEEEPRLHQPPIPQSDKHLIPDLPQLQGAELEEREEISTVPRMLGEEFPNAKFVEGPILEDVGLRDRGVITVGSQAIIRWNVHD